MTASTSAGPALACASALPAASVPMDDAFCVRAPEQLHSYSVQPDHDSSVVTRGIEPLAQPVQAWQHNQIGDLGGDAPGEHLTQHVADQLQRAFAGFQRDVAGETVGD